MQLYFVMSSRKESIKLEVIESTPLLIGTTIAILVLIAGIVSLSVVYGGYSDKNNESTINVINNINVNIGKESMKGTYLYTFIMCRL